MRSIKPFDVRTVLKIYYTHPGEIGNTQLKELFGINASSTLSHLKAKIRNRQIEDGEKTLNPLNVSTKSVFAYAGIDIEEMKKRYQEGKKLGLWDGLN